MADSQTRITLDLELSGMPVEGRLAPVGGEQRSFTGYAGLIAALEAIREGDDGRSGHGRGSEQEER
jgi:hypothetical protein